MLKENIHHDSSVDDKILKKRLGYGILIRNKNYLSHNYLNGSELSFLRSSIFTSKINVSGLPTEGTLNRDILYLLQQFFSILTTGVLFYSLQKRYKVQSIT